jgi:hydrogenase maturation factor
MVLVVRQADTAELVRALDGTGAAVIGKVVAQSGPERVLLV